MRHHASIRRTLALLTWGLGLLLSCGVRADPVINPEEYFPAGEQLKGVPLYMTYDEAGGTLYVASMLQVYPISLPAGAPPTMAPSEARPAAVVPGRQVFLAPGGGKFVQIEPKGPTWTLSSMADGEDQSIAPIPDRVSWTLRLGYQAKVFVVGEPTATVEGATGAWKWTFWRDGRPAGDPVTTERRAKVEIGPQGEGVVVLGAESAVLYDRSARPIREVRGSYRAAALSSGGGVLLLNRMDEVKEIVIDTGEPDREEVEAPDSVHGMRISPGGTRAMIWMADGRVHTLDPRSGRLGPERRVPLQGRQFISSATIDDDGLITLGGQLKPRGAGRYRDGWIAQMKDDRVLWHQEHALGTVSSKVPQAVPAGEDRIAVRDLEKVTVYRIDD